MKEEDILKKIYYQALQKRQSGLQSSKGNDNGLKLMKSQSSQENAHPSAGKRPATKAELPTNHPRRVAAIKTMIQRNLSLGQSKLAHSQEGEAKVLPSNSVQSPTPHLNKAPSHSSMVERDELMNGLMNVYREKRKMIDALPSRHREMLEKMGNIMLGTSPNKQPPRQH